MKIGKTFEAIENISTSLMSTIGNACNRTSFTKSLFDDCNNAQKIFSTTRKAARVNGSNQVKSLTKGISAFAKEVGPIPFTTAAAGFCFLPVGGTTIGLVTGLLAKKGLKYIF